MMATGKLQGADEEETDEVTSMEEGNSAAELEDSNTNMDLEESAEEDEGGNMRR